MTSLEWSMDWDGVCHITRCHSISENVCWCSCRYNYPHVDAPEACGTQPVGGLVGLRSPNHRLTNQHERESVKGMAQLPYRAPAHCAERCDVLFYLFPLNVLVKRTNAFGKQPQSVSMLFPFCKFEFDFYITKQYKLRNKYISLLMKDKWIYIYIYIKKNLSST